jgi:hypothetical protein
MASPASLLFRPVALTALVLAASSRPAAAGDEVYVSNTSMRFFTLELEPPPAGGANAPVLASRLDERANQSSMVELVHGGDAVPLPSGATLVLVFLDRPIGQVPDYERVGFQVVDSQGHTAATFDLWKVSRKGAGAGATWTSIQPRTKGAGFLSADPEHLVITSH